MTPEALAALCGAAMPDERLTPDELTYLCFGPGDEIVGDADGCAVLQVQRRADAQVAVWLTLLAVAPDAQGSGRGKQLVREAAERARTAGAHDLLLAASVPRYIWPGVDVTNTRAGMLLESCGFTLHDVRINMSVPTSLRREPPPGFTVERETGTGAQDFAAAAFPDWMPELDRAVEMGTAFAARGPDGRTVSFGCHSVNRADWVGPMATDPSLQHGGIGSAVLAAVCGDLEARGRPAGEVSWVSNLRFYGKCGATVSRAFLGGRLRLA